MTLKGKVCDPVGLEWQRQ